MMKLPDVVTLVKMKLDNLLIYVPRVEASSHTICWILSHHCYVIIAQPWLCSCARVSGVTHRDKAYLTQTVVSENTASGMAEHIKHASRMRDNTAFPYFHTTTVLRPEWRTCWYWCKSNHASCQRGWLAALACGGRCHIAI